jgi:hypothetical protein
MKNRNDQLSAIFRPLIGQKPWQVRLGYGSFITMEFGKRTRDSWVTQGERRSAVHGEWHLWIYQCEWKLVRNRKRIVSSEDARERLGPAVEILQGRSLESVCIHDNDFNTDFIFSGGLALRSNGYADEDPGEERWLLYMPHHKVLLNLPGMLVVKNSNEADRVPLAALA